MTKSNFLKILISLPPKEINKIIEEKGKDQKMVKGIIYLSKEDK